MLEEKGPATVHPQKKRRRRPQRKRDPIYISVSRNLKSGKNM